MTSCLNGGLDLGQRRVLGVSQQTVSVKDADEVWLSQRMPLLIGLLLQIREDGGISSGNNARGGVQIRPPNLSATHPSSRCITIDDVSNRSFTSASLGNPFQEDGNHSQRTQPPRNVGNPCHFPGASRRNSASRPSLSSN